MTAGAWQLSVGSLAALLVGGCFDFTLSTRPEITDKVDSGAPDSGTHIDSAETQIDHPCYNVVCEATPPPSCVGKSGKIVYYNREEFCEMTDAGEPSCPNAEHQEECPGACSEGHCVDTPCQGVTCDEPPAPRCLEDGKLNVSSPLGHCNEKGACDYTSDQLACANGCVDGACVGEPCAGIICDTPAPKFCYEGNLVVAARPGLCNDVGLCVYSHEIVPCAAGCSEGNCI